ncbi:hypothetical protein ACFQ8C_12560 [Streptomyces sp. NPDC056503]
MAPDAPPPSPASSPDTRREQLTYAALDQRSVFVGFTPAHGPRL